VLEVKNNAWKIDVTTRAAVTSRVAYRGDSSPFFGIGILRYQKSSVSVFLVSILGV
jgi:hypothetical protein